MKVSLIGFSVSSSNSYIDLPYFFNYLSKTKNSRKIVYKHCVRYFFFDNERNADYSLGMIITVKDQKSFLKFKMEGGRHIIKKANLQGEEKLLDFNFFVINKSNGCGLYTHYFHSCSVRELGSVLRSWFYDLRDELKKRNVKVPEASWVGKGVDFVTRRANRKYKGRFRFSIITRAAGLDQVLQTMQAIKNVEVVIDAVTQSPARPGVPLTNKSRRVTEKFTIGDGWGVDALIQDVVELSDMDGLQRGKVLCVTPDGKEEYVKFFKSPNNFGEYDYDDLTEKIDNLRTDDFSSHSIYDELIEIMEKDENEAIFNSEIEED